MEYKQLISILTEVRELINTPNTNVVWTRYEHVDKLINNIDLYIDELRKEEESIIEKVEILFAPTGTLQEISIDNGWGDRFIELSIKVDYLLI